MASTRLGCTGASGFFKGGILKDPTILAFPSLFSSSLFLCLLHGCYSEEKGEEKMQSHLLSRFSMANWFFSFKKNRFIYLLSFGSSHVW